MTKKTKRNLSEYLDIPFFKKIKMDNHLIIEKTKYTKRFKETILSKVDDYLNARPYKYKYKKQEYTERELFIKNLNIMLKEIQTSLWKLYITMSKTRSVRGNKSFTREQLLQYYYENYLNELYIYTERILNIITFVEKKAEKLQMKVFYKILVGARQTYNEVYKDIRKTRNEHNHKERFNDYDFGRLQILETLEYTKYLTQKEKDKIYLTIKKRYCKDMLAKVIELHKSTQVVFVPIDVIVYDEILPRLK